MIPCEALTRHAPARAVTGAGRDCPNREHKGMTMTMTIKRHGSDEIVTLSPDVRDTHPAWVHEQMGTTSESELQAALNQYSADDCTGERDVCGIAMSDDMTTTKATHTLGLVTVERHTDIDVYYVKSSNAEIAVTYGDTDGTRAARIALCLNSHDDLLAACEALVGETETLASTLDLRDFERQGGRDAINNARAAIAKAKP
jgi:phage tail sheath gpL-like